MTGFNWIKRKRQKEGPKVEKVIKSKPEEKPLVYSEDGENYFLNMSKYLMLHGMDDEKAFDLFDKLMSSENPVTLIFE